MQDGQFSRCREARLLGPNPTKRDETDEKRRLKDALLDSSTSETGKKEEDFPDTNLTGLTSQNQRLEDSWPRRVMTVSDLDPSSETSLSSG